LQTGVYRSDIPVKFKLMKEGYQDLIDRVEEIMDFALEKEMGGIKKEDVENYDEIKT
jgi:DNA polymerase epsilon subunit 1